MSQPLIAARNLNKTFGARPLFRDFSLGIHEKEKVGLIGPNGGGKTTLLKIFAEIETIDSGLIEKKSGLRIGYLAQVENFPGEKTVFSFLEDVLARYSDDRLQNQVKINKLLGKFDFFDPEKKIGELSGGWRKRLSICSQIIIEPDLLLLDEPTNHLDFSGILWLEKYLKQSSLTFILISHDRAFLENCADRIIEINPVFPSGYFSAAGKYQAFLEKRESFLESEKKLEQTLKSQVRKEVEWLRRGPRARATKSFARIKEAENKINELSDLKGRLSLDQKIQVQVLHSHRQTKELIKMNKIGITLGEKKPFHSLSLILSPGKRLGVIGNNGTGKTTLLKIIEGILPPQTGSISYAPDLRIAYFDQGREALEGEAPLKQVLSPNGDTIIYQGREIHITSWGRQFLFDKEKLDTRVSDLSGGERARALMARLLINPVDVLLLDEPTNDLDISSLEVLEESLSEFPGVIVLVTHDRKMLENVCTEFVGFYEPNCAANFASYQQWAERYEEAKTKKPDPQKSVKTEQVKTVPTKKPGLSHAEFQERNRLEGRIEKAEAKIELEKTKLNDPAILNDYQKLTALCEKIKQMQTELDGFYERWGELDP